jgi:hypothetical protein
LPLTDQSVDRIICFDAFHHVRDQAQTLKEFARVLKPGGRAAFMEPGPNHSQTALSQAEMANHKVIENDVSMDDVTRHALAAGLDKPQMLVQFQRPLQVGVDEFNRWAQGGVPLARAARIKHLLESQLTDGQCFYIGKGQAAVPDSRSAEGLACELSLRSAHRVAGKGRGSIRLEVMARNTGRRDWITSPGAGIVNLGLHLLAADGRVVNNNFGRIRLPAGGVPIGQTVVVNGSVAMPTQDDFVLELDLVAEHVAWFSDLGGSRALRVPSAELGFAPPPAAGPAP